MSMSKMSMSMSKMSMSMSMSDTSSRLSSKTSSMGGMSRMSGMSGMSMQTSASSSNSNGLASRSSSTSSMPMSTGMDMGSDKKMMHSWLTPTYHDYPVLFKGLHANTSGKQFGIFLLIVVAAFVYKFLTYVSWCLEVHWFKKWSKGEAPQESRDAMTNQDNEAGPDDPLPKMPNFMLDLFFPSWIDLFHDFIRAILTFCSTMLIYMLMLAAMSFVLTYVFAVITGLALAEVFFNRCKICTLRRWEIKRQIVNTRTCPGYSNCKCGRHTSPPVTSPTRTVGATSGEYEKMPSPQASRLEEHDSTISENDGNNEVDETCCCGGERREQEAEIRAENDILENARWNEQAGDMDTNLLPAEKFR